MRQVLHPEVDSARVQAVQEEEGDGKHGDTENVCQLLSLQPQLAVAALLIPGPHALQSAHKSHGKNCEDSLQQTQKPDD